MSDLPLPDPTPEAALPDVLDIQHDTDPGRDEGIARHIPHIGHAILFFSLAFMSILLCDGTIGVALHITTREDALRHPLSGFLGECLGYVLTIGLAWFLFRMLWRKPFLRGISWTARAARRFWWQLILIGFALSAFAQGCELLFKKLPESEVTQLLRSPLSAWLLIVLGATIAPLMEEIAFRGFLLPALATAYDWLSLDRTPAAIDRWQRSNTKSLSALVFGSVMSSIAFALIHGAQLHWAKGPLAVLFLTSLGFSAVYVRLRSVAASTLVHVAYDSLIFLELIIKSDGFRHLDKIT